MKTVLGFDSWVGGASHFARLVPALRERGINLVLLHLGSWGGDAGRPTTEKIGELEVRDIQYYKGLRFDEILQKESPAAVLFLSNDVFAHRAFNRYSLHAGIPTLRLYHGLVRVQSVNTGSQYKVNLINQARFLLERLPKALTKIWPCYLGALSRTKGSKADWMRFVTDILHLSRGHYIAKGSEDSRTTACAVYTQADVIHAVTKYGHKPEDVHVVGNPDLQNFGLQEDQIGSGLGKLDRKNWIVYVDTGLIYAGMVFQAADDYFHHLIATKDGLASQGYQMKIKLHPDHFRTQFPARLQDAGIEVLSNKNFVSTLQESVGAIVEPSTAALIPGLVGIPMLLANHGKLSSQTYGEVLVSYPRARSLNDVSKVQELLQEEATSFDLRAVEGWIGENVGPLPTMDMPKRVASIVESLIR